MEAVKLTISYAGMVHVHVTCKAWATAAGVVVTYTRGGFGEKQKPC